MGAVVLPAEYGRDPLHTGAALGLMSLAKSVDSPTATAVAPGESAEVSAPVINGVFVAQPGAYKIDSRELKLQSGDGNVGDGKPDRQPLLVPQETDYPAVDTEESHLGRI